MTSQNVENAKPCKGCSDNPLPSREFFRSETLIPFDKKPPKGTMLGPLDTKEDYSHTSVWSVYTGGGPEGPLINVILTLPVDYKRVQIHLDGSLEYKKGLDDWEPPSPIDGYECDLENQWFFRPLWESCTWRRYSTIVKNKCQCIEVITRCNLNFNWVKFEDCQQCEARFPIDPVPVYKRKTVRDLHLPDLDHNSK